MTILFIILAALAVMLMSLIGIFTVAKVFRDWAEKNLKYLATFATGVFIVVAYNLIVETTHSELGAATIVGVILIGMLIAYATDKVLPDSHHHHDSGEDVHIHSPAGARRIILSDMLHNITDGFLIVPAFLIDIRLGLITTAGIMIHEVAQEISEFFVLKSAGYSTKKALIINFATSASIFIGIAATLLISNISEDIIFILLAAAAGIIVYTIVRDLIPYSIAVAKKDKTYFKHALAAIVGAAIIATLTSVTAESHVHSHEEHGVEDHAKEHNEAHAEDAHIEEVYLDEAHAEEEIHTEDNH